MFFMQCTDVKLSGSTPEIKTKQVEGGKKKNVPPMCVLSCLFKMAACRGITYLWWRAAAPDPPASGRRSSAGPGCTECGAHAVFPKVWTGGSTNSASLHLPPSDTWRCCSAAPPPSSAPSGRVALQRPEKKSHQNFLLIQIISDKPILQPFHGGLVARFTFRSTQSWCVL